LLDAKQFTAFSADQPRSIEAGGAFSLFGGHIIGRTWNWFRISDRSGRARVTGPEGVFHRAIRTKPQGSGTHLVFDHIGSGRFRDILPTVGSPPLGAAQKIFTRTQAAAFHPC
jgi:hypothetical protein